VIGWAASAASCWPLRSCLRGVGGHPRGNHTLLGGVPVGRSHRAVGGDEVGQGRQGRHDFGAELTLDAEEAGVGEKGLSLAKGVRTQNGKLAMTVLDSGVAMVRDEAEKNNRGGI
jgi:hypothetical protein